MSTEEELTKLKVSDLKDKLKELDLPLTGKKAELVARLVEHFQDPTSPVAATNDGEATAAAATPAAAVADAKDPEPVKEDATAETAAAAPAAAVTAPAAASAANGAVPKIAARAARFGLPLKGSKAAAGLSGATVKTTTAGKTQGAKKGTAAMTPEQLARIKARADKYGTADQIGVLAQEKKADKLAKRKAKFGQEDGSADADGDAKKKSRMEKFGGKGKIAAAVVELTPEQKAKVEARKARFAT